MDETGKRLVANYKNRFEVIFEKASLIEFDEESFNVYKLWGIVSIILGFSESGDIKKSAKIIEDNAFAFMGKKGPRIDYKLKKLDSKVYLDPLWTIRTAMSFRLAGVDVLTLSFGVVESFAEFISNRLDDIKSEIGIDAVVINGSLLEVKSLFDRVYKNVAKNHELYFNKELPTDRANIAYGGACLL